MSLLLESRRDTAAAAHLRCLAADIGGTNARFATAALGENERVRLAAQRSLKVADHDGIESALDAYFSGSGEPVPHRPTCSPSGSAASGSRAMLRWAARSNSHMPIGRWNSHADSAPTPMIAAIHSAAR